MTEKIFRIYLDNCCYNRPYDDQAQIRISLETQAKIFIPNGVRCDKIELATSCVLRHENNKNAYATQRSASADFMEKHTAVFVDFDKIAEIKKIAEEIMSTSVKEVDTAHITCAILAECNYFLTTDHRVLRYCSDKIKIMNPIEFLKVLEVTQNVQHD